LLTFSIDSAVGADALGALAAGSQGQQAVVSAAEKEKRTIMKSLARSRSQRVENSEVSSWSMLQRTSERKGWEGCFLDERR